MTALRRPDKLRRFRDGMCAVVGMVRKKKNMELQWGRSIAAGAVDCWKDNARILAHFRIPALT